MLEETHYDVSPARACAQYLQLQSWRREGWCRLLCPEGSENGKCDCYGPEECSAPKQMLLRLGED